MFSDKKIKAIGVDLKVLHEMLIEIDTNKDGFITLYELKHVVKTLVRYAGGKRD